MSTINRPSKEQVRQWLAERQLERTPLPDPVQIRHALAWAGPRAHLPEPKTQKFDAHGIDRDG
jgi:hypothetical protein